MPDFAGRTIAVATQEGELAILNGTGNVRWRSTLPHPAAALEVDALGRFLIYGVATGEITRLDLHGGSEPRRGPSAGGRRAPGSGPVRRADWAVEVAKTDEQAESAVLAVRRRPAADRRHHADEQGRAVHPRGHEPGSRARYLRASAGSCGPRPGWVAAATDRQIVVCDLRANSARRVDVVLHQLTHLAIDPDGFGLAMVQERDRIGRATLAGRWVWKTELNTPVEEIAIGPDGHCAIGTEDGRLRVYDPAGKVAGEYRADPAEPLLVAAHRRDRPSGSSGSRSCGGARPSAGTTSPHGSCGRRRRPGRDGASTQSGRWRW